MYSDAKVALKCYSLIFVGFLLLRTFYNGAVIGIKNKSLMVGIKDSIESALYIPIIIYIANI